MGELKAGWKRVKFGEIAECVNDRVDDPAKAGVERYVGLEHLDPESLTIRRWGTPDEVESTKLRFKTGDIIFGKRRAYQRKLAVADFEGICSAHAMVLRAKPGRVIPEFLPFFMQSDLFMERAVAISVGSLSPTINWRTLATEEFVLPPLEEQRRMSMALNSLRAAADEIANLRASGDALLQALSISLMRDACSGVSYRPLGDLCIRLPQSGIYKPSEYLGAGVPLVQMGELFGNDTVSPDVCTTRLQVDADELAKFSLGSGDLLFGRRSIVLSGAGRCVLVDRVNEPAVFESSILRIRVDSSRILPQFLFEWFRSPIGTGAITRIVTFTTVAGIKGSDLQKVLIPSLPPSRQSEICEAMADARANLSRTRFRAETTASLARAAVQAMLETAP